MGEQPLHTCSAFIFTIDPKTMRSWCPATSRAVDVSFFYDPNRACYRVVSVEEGPQSKKVVIHSTITEKMAFKKTSQKFGQWTDKASVYGLGFNCESDLDKFMEQFTHAVEATKLNKMDDISPEANHNSSPSLISEQNLIHINPLTASTAELKQAITAAQSVIVRLEEKLKSTKKESDERAVALEAECKRLKEQLVVNSPRTKELLQENLRLTQRITILESQLAASNDEKSNLHSLHSSMTQQMTTLMDLHKQMAGLVVTPGKPSS